MIIKSDDGMIDMLKYMCNLCHIYKDEFICTECRIENKRNKVNEHLDKKENEFCCECRKWKELDCSKCVMDNMIGVI